MLFQAKRLLDFLFPAIKKTDSHSIVNPSYFYVGVIKVRGIYPKNTLSLQSNDHGNLSTSIRNLRDCFVVCEQVYKTPRNDTSWFELHPFVYL